MKWMFWFMLPGLLVGCDTPSPAFRGADPVRISVGKSTFDVRIKGNRAEAVRLNREWAPRLEAVAPRAVAAIEKVSGCEVVKTGGDAALIVARLRCKGAPAPPPPAGPLVYDCDVEDAYVPSGSDTGYGAMVCTVRDG